MPYFWGTVGIVYNREMLGGKTITSWNDLWDPDLRNQILLVDGAREVMGMALNSLGYSLNDTNKAHLQEAKRKLDRLMPNVKAIVGDEIKLLLANEEAAIGVVWSGDAAEIISENDKLDYVVPKEGSNLWFRQHGHSENSEKHRRSARVYQFYARPETRGAKRRVCRLFDAE